MAPYLNKIRILFLFQICPLLFVKAQQDAQTALTKNEGVENTFKSAERRLHHDGSRELAHLELTSTPLYGNSTDFMYFYVTVFIGSHR